MQVFSGQIKVVQVQWLIWVTVALLIFFSLLPGDGFAQSAVYSLINTLIYAAIIYGNISWLYPRYYEKGNYLTYLAASIALLLITGMLRGCISWAIYNAYFAPKPIPMSPKIMFNFVIAGLLVFLLSHIFRIAIAYFKLKQQTEDILLQKGQAELQLLKAQVQPHFLFNTLNNIYYEAYREAPRTAGLIERLSDIMRYFVDQSNQELVSLRTEIEFIESYIELEKIRIRNSAEIHFEKKYDPQTLIPPMLLMTFVENIFKHGIDKSGQSNQVSLSLIQSEKELRFETCNKIPYRQEDSLSLATAGSGINNLKERLHLLYGGRAELRALAEDSCYRSFLKIPLS
ncbi:sensor histidine kinase [Pedobacter nutrimenti]|jgi:hypothetical protein|uniref:Histidine kinase n=1 Tax=Pedobacter nutrimenti TaxID=1241337 RepID=A0A318UDU2_9SPHI|nr:histidine kinase [Pedobacter nutrimenti]PYF72829.1 histidine kinase [Pedobacter nutrimenti]